MTDQDLLQIRQLFEVMERLRAPGGCPWDRTQTHKTLLPFLLEEAYETIEAAEREDDRELAEELGDLLVEVAMHCAIAGEAGTFGVGEVARRAREKMVGRHPHVFGDLEVSGVDQVLSNWEELKRKEKPARESALDGIPDTLPALSLAAAVQRRQPGMQPKAAPEVAARAALRRLATAASAEQAEAQLGELLYQVVAVARARHLDAEGALRRHSRARRQELRAVEVAAKTEPVSAAPPPGAEPK